MGDYPTAGSNGNDDSTGFQQGVAERPVAFVNKNSGERAAATFVRAQLERCLGKENVFDLFPEKGNSPAIEEAKQFLLDVRPDIIIVAGGDGTVSLGMDIADALRQTHQIGKYDCPVAVLPMGTGNDLSRSLGFGGGYVKPIVNPKKKFTRLIEKTKCARQRFVDRFQFDLYLAPAADSASDDEDVQEAVQGPDRANSNSNAAAPPPTLTATEQGRDIFSAEEAEGSPSKKRHPQPPSRVERHSPAHSSTRAPTPVRSTANPIAYRTPTNAQKVLSKSFMNYFSVGFDADIATNFGDFRERHPKACANRAMNKMWYCCFGCQAMCCSSRFPKHRVSLRIDDVPLRVPSKSQAIVVGNMLTYAGGAVLWQDDTHKYPTPVVDDGKAEVCILDGVMHMVGVGAKVRSARKMGQGSRIRIRVPADYVMQYDGEPVAATGDGNQDCIVYVTHAGQSLGMELTGAEVITTEEDSNAEEEETEAEEEEEQTQN